jgi:abequosyltransferase
MIPQAKKYNIPIYVSDNASTDNTLEVIEHFKKSYPLLYYRTNNQNSGVDQNMVAAVKMASTKYVWAFGSRRILLPGMLDRVHKVLREDGLDLLVLNDPNPAFAVPNSRYYNSAKEVFRELNRHLTGLGFQVLPLEAWKTEYILKYANTEWTIFGVTLEFLASKHDVKAFFISEPCAESSGMSQWVCRSFQIWAKWKKVVHFLPNTYSDEDKEFVIKKSVNYLFARPNFDLINLRTKGIYDAEVFQAIYEDLMRYGDLSPNVAYAISRFPIIPLKLYREFLRAVTVFLRMFIHQKARLNPTQRRLKKMPYD